MYLSSLKGKMRVKQQLEAPNKDSVGAGGTTVIPVTSQVYTFSKGQVCIDEQIGTCLALYIYLKSVNPSRQ